MENYMANLSSSIMPHVRMLSPFSPQQLIVISLAPVSQSLMNKAVQRKATDLVAVSDLTACKIALLNLPFSSVVFFRRQWKKARPKRISMRPPMSPQVAPPETEDTPLKLKAIDFLRKLFR